MERQSIDYFRPTSSNLNDRLRRPGFIRTPDPGYYLHLSRGSRQHNVPPLPPLPVPRPHRRHGTRHPRPDPHHRPLPPHLPPSVMQPLVHAEGRVVLEVPAPHPLSPPPVLVWPPSTLPRQFDPHHPPAPFLSIHLTQSSPTPEGPSRPSPCPFRTQNPFTTTPPDLFPPEEVFRPVYPPLYPALQDLTGLYPSTPPSRHLPPEPPVSPPIPSQSSLPKLWSDPPSKPPPTPPPNPSGRPVHNLDS